MYILLLDPLLLRLERQHYLTLPTLKYRRLRGDMIEVFEIITGKYDNEIAVTLKNS